MADKASSSSNSGAAEPAERIPARPKGGVVERTFTRLFMRPARVTATVDLSKNFRLIDFQDEALKGCSWSPGDKVQVKLDGGFITRTYTPMSWNSDEGTTQFLAYCHGVGPGSEWARNVTAGDERQFFGPRSSLSLDGLSRQTVVFGDETSFALALTLERSAGADTTRRYLFEVSDAEEAASVLRAVGLPEPVLVQRTPDDEHLRRICGMLPDFMQPASTFILCGKAPSIQQVSRALKANGTETRRLRTKAYWAPGKTGLD